MKRKGFYVRDAAHPMVAKIGTRNTRDGAEVLAGFYPPGAYRIENCPDGSLKVWRTDAGADATTDARPVRNADPRLTAINARNREYYTR